MHINKGVNLFAKIVNIVQIKSMSQSGKDDKPHIKCKMIYLLNLTHPEYKLRLGYQHHPRKTNQRQTQINLIETFLDKNDKIPFRQQIR